MTHYELFENVKVLIEASHNFFDHFNQNPYVNKHIAEVQYTACELPMLSFLLAMLLEEHMVCPGYPGCRTALPIE